MGDNYPGSPIINVQHLKKYKVDTTHLDRTVLLIHSCANLSPRNLKWRE